VPGPGGLDYLGAVGSGFAEVEHRDLTALLLSLERPDSPFPPLCRPISPAVPDGPARSSPPRSPTPGSPRLDGCATLSGAACAPREHTRSPPAVQVRRTPSLRTGAPLVFPQSSFLRDRRAGLRQARQPLARVVTAGERRSHGDGRRRARGRRRRAPQGGRPGWHEGPGMGQRLGSGYPVT
jgi:hypothetical protein